MFDKSQKLLGLITILKVIWEIVFAVLLFVYLLSAFIGAAWVLQDIFESEGRDRELGTLFALAVPFIWAVRYGMKKQNEDRS